MRSAPPTPSPFALLPLLAAALLALAPRAVAQRPTFAVLFLRNAAGEPVEGAEAILLPQPAHTFAALPTPTPDLAAAVTATSSPTGTIRLPTEHAGAVLVATANGLGAVVPRLLPKDARVVKLRQMGTVRASDGDGDGDEPFVLWAALRSETGERVVLPPQHGVEIPLPEGTYECWAQRGDVFVWQRLAVRSGGTATVAFAWPGLRLQRRAGAAVHPEDWPQITLLGDTAATCELRGGALLATLVAHTADGSVTLAHPPGPPGAEPQPYPPAAAELPRTTIAIAGADGAPTQATVHSVRRMPGGSWQVLATATAGDDGKATLPQPDDGDTWLLATLPDGAAVATRWSDRHADRPLTPAATAPLVVDVVTDDGLPAIDACLEYVPHDAEVATIVAHTDARGRATFGPVATPGMLRSSDARYANQQQELATLPTQPLRLVATTGHQLTGHARFDDGTPAAGAIVTLRDPRGELRPGERAAVVGKDGSFAFGGLPEDPSFALFGSTLRNQRTWSGLIRAARTSDTIELILRNEDPVLGNPQQPR